ncbi:hypothetical protein COC42_00250 [Sphingomonas spermidinifaciens]|uniref:Uncharacterized protein n=2 Tax=Sphingomonas spermidinifaciens TaxID=1141889 RepID=A0A2A4B5K0_9SPHN|nr:hypothetical protein COC42_00250 [Sphingomonas spermidinifaciens]
MIAAALVAVPATAKADWVHKPTGLRVPDAIGDDFRKGETRDASDGKQANIWVQYGTDEDAATLYVYRSAYPDAGLWFHRTEAAMRGNVGLSGDLPPPWEVTLFGAAAPNGLRQVYTLDGRTKGFRSTALLIVNHGEWLIKVRLSSRSLDAQALDGRLDRFVAAMRLGKADDNPLAHIAECEGAAPPATISTPVTDTAEQMRTLVEGGALAQMAARGASGPAKDDSGWCRVRDDRLAPIATVFRERDGANWVMLIGDSGIAAATRPTLIDTKPKLSGLFLQTHDQTALIEAYDRPPAPEAAISGALGPVLSGQRKPIASISMDDKKR